MTCMMTHEQIQQIFSEESEDDEFWGFESILLNLVNLIRRFDSRGWGWCLLVLEIGVSYTRVYVVLLYYLKQAQLIDDIKFCCNWSPVKYKL